MHQITEIRQAAAALLKKRFKRVYASRGLPSAQTQLPCVAVYIDGRGSTVFNEAPQQYKHTVRLVTAVYVQDNQSAEAVAEEMLAIVEGLFYANPTLRRTEADGSSYNVLADDLQPESLTVELADGGEMLSLCYLQSWQAVYFDNAADFAGLPQYHPQTLIGPAFNDPAEPAQAWAHWQLYGSNPEIDATDKNLPRD